MLPLAQEIPQPQSSRSGRASCPAQAPWGTQLHQSDPVIAVSKGVLLCHHTEQYLTLYSCLSFSLHRKLTACLQRCKKSPSCYMWSVCMWSRKARLKGSAKISAHIMWCKS